MIALSKLERLPHSQRLRKIAKTAEEAEAGLLPGKTESAVLDWLAGALGLLARDGFPPAALEALEKAAAEIRLSCGEPGPGLRRALNSVRHILMAETGRYPAEWDFDAQGDRGGLDAAKRRIFPGLAVYLEDIRSPFNVGSMFRTAESFGVEKIFLSPFCADPLHPRAQRTAMGCVSILPWERLPKDPFTQPWEENPFGDLPLFALETGGAPLGEFPFPSRGVMIAGSEELGVSPWALAAADASLGRVSIVTFGAKGSLNVATAFGIVMQAWAAALGSESL
jgi:TrmH family RNA methyltransferase